MTFFSGRQPNLLPTRTRWFRVRISRAAMLAAVSAPVLAVLLLSGAFSGGRDSRATIADQLDQGTTAPAETRAPEPAVSVLSASPATGLARGVTRDTVRWFDEATGRAYEGNVHTSAVRTVSDAAVPDFADGIWIPGTEQAVVVSDGARAGRTYELTDYRTGEKTVLEPGISLLSVSSDGSRIAYVVPGPDGSAHIKTAKPDGSDSRTVFRTRLGFAELTWQGNATLLLASWKPDTMRTNLVALSLDGGITTLLAGKENIELIVSDNGALLVSYYDASGGVVATLDPGTAQERRLLEFVSARKCGWAPGSRTLVCGVPKEGTWSGGSSLSASNDELVVIDAASGAATAVVATSENRVSVLDPVISSSGSRAAFIDLFDRRVHVVEL